MKRRDLFKVMGWAGANALFFKVMGSAEAQANGKGFTDQVDPYAPNDFKGLGRQAEAYTFFTGEEAKFIEAAVARLLPRDASGPGALETGCGYYIDQQLAGSFGQAGRWYMQGPWQPGTPMQGYQLPLTPAEVYRAGISAAQHYSNQMFSKDFDELRGDHQDQILKALEASKVSDPNVPTAVTQQFFAFLLQNTVEGFLADPAYGGNRGKSGWQQLGFPGVYLENYGDFIDQPMAKLPKIIFVDLADAQNNVMAN